MSCVSWLFTPWLVGVPPWYESMSTGTVARTSALRTLAIPVLLTATTW